MDTVPVLKPLQTQSAISGIAKAYGIDPAEAAPAVESLAESVAARLTRLTLSRGGIADIVGLLGDPNAQRALSDPAAATGQAAIDDGNQVLDVLIGDKHVSRGIAQRAASQSGIDVEIAKKLLPVVASMVIGSMQKTAEPQIAKIASKIPAAQMAAGADYGSPLPVPGDNIPGVGRRAPPPADNPFDNLPDIIRRGGTQAPGGGGSLEAILRQILGNLLGNNGGVVSTIIKGLVLRWIANFIRRMFTR